MLKTHNPYPLVTVYIPTYNRVELLQRAVDSVLSQDYKNIELIVVDDNSSDGTHEYLAKMVKEDSRFKFFINDENSGACVSRNKAIFAAQGEFITGLDDDDYFLSNRISSFLKKSEFIANDTIALYSHVYFKVNDTNRFIKSKKAKQCHHNQLLIDNWIGNQIFTKTEYLKEIGGFDPSFPAWQDLECWYRLLKHFHKKATLLPIYTYIVDISHPHERISSKKLTSIFEAFDTFIDKHNLSNKDSNVLALQLMPYTKVPPTFSSITRGFIRKHSLKNLKRTLHFIKEKIKYTIDFNRN